MHGVVNKFSTVSTVGGSIVNRQIDCEESQRSYKESVHSQFSFFMAIFSQVFKKSLFNFNQEFTSMSEFNGERRIDYEHGFHFCSDGHVFETIRYNVDDKGTSDLSTLIGVLYEGKLGSVYKSPIMDIDVDIWKEMNGYYPGCQKMYCENLLKKICSKALVTDMKIVGINTCMKLTMIVLM